MKLCQHSVTAEALVGKTIIVFDISLRLFQEGVHVSFARLVPVPRQS